MNIHTQPESEDSFCITTILEKSLPDLVCKGVLLAISENGNIKTYSAGSITPEDKDRSYYIYSISKTFTAVAIMKLCEDQGDFLDETFCSFFPQANIPHDVTIRQLLNHTSGLSDYFSSPEYQQAIKEHPTKPWSYEKLMKFGLSKTPLFPPNAGWAYSNPGYALLKELIELKSGSNYYDYLDKIIIKKAHLTNTRPFVEIDYDLSLLPGEDNSFQGDFRSLYHPDWIATGCLVSTASDVAKFYDALFSDQLLTEKSINEMKKTVDVLPSPPKESIPSYGLGLMHFKNSPLADGFGHGGGGPGYTTYAVNYSNLKGSSIT